MSKIQVDAIEPQCGTTLTVGASGTTVTVPSNVVKSNALQASDAGNIISQSGTTITLGATGDTINLASGASQTGFGRTGTVDWDTTPKTATFTAVSGDGFFCNTSGGAFTVNLPAGSAGAIVSLADYAATWQTNNLTVAPNGTDKIGSTNASAVLSTQGQSVTFVFVDATQGWINTMDSTSNVRGVPPFIAATGGTITTVDTNFKVHTFTGPGTFTVTNAGEPGGSNTVSYMVVAGGGGAGYYYGAAGGAGGFRESKAATDTYTASPLNATSGPTYNLPVSVQGYPVVIGGGGAARGSGSGSGPATAGSGTASSALAITSAGGGGGSGGNSPGGGTSGISGGSGGGGGGASPGSDAGSGNTPPVSPPQGNSGEPSSGNRGGSGGGAIEAGGTDGTNLGGDGATTSINGTPTAFAGGGGGSNPGQAGGDGGGSTGGSAQSGAANTGGGQGGCSPAGAGGSGIVIIRYKFQ